MVRCAAGCSYISCTESNNVVHEHDECAVCARIMNELLTALGMYTVILVFTMISIVQWDIVCLQNFELFW